MAPTLDRLDYILPGPDQTETIYHQPKNNKFQTSTKPMDTPCIEVITSYNMLIRDINMLLAQFGNERHVFH